jgi:hypothetical protein
MKIVLESEEVLKEVVIFNVKTSKKQSCFRYFRKIWERKRKNSKCSHNATMKKYEK